MSGGADGAAPPLDGIRVVEFGTGLAGPFCAMTLADYGADVVKVEQAAHGGDPSRAADPSYPNGVSHLFAAANRNKRGLALDLGRPQGVDVARRLIARADIVVDDCSLGILERFGLGAQALTDAHPRLIYCRISGYGATGPRAGEPTDDLLMQAYAGNMSVTGEEDGGPCKAGIPVSDMGAADFATVGILLALAARRRTGRGQIVDTSLMEAQVAMMSYHVARYFATGKSPLRQGSAMLGSPSRAYRCKDDWLVLAGMTERHWTGLLRALGRPEWIADPEYGTMEARRRNGPKLIELFRGIFVHETVAHWGARFDAEGVPWTRINSIAQMTQEEQVRARDMIVELGRPGGDAMKLPGLPIKLSATPGRIRLPPPLLGEHTSEILRELGAPEERLADKG